MWKTLSVSFRMLVVLTVLTGAVYPLMVTGVAQLFFSRQANGSLLMRGNTMVGSALIGQNFISDRYFHSRPSAVDCNPLPSSGSNLGPTSAALRDKIAERAAYYKPASINEIPADLLTASGSGLDPHLSPEAVYFQLARILESRRIDSARRSELERLIVDATEQPQLGILGEKRINILRLNIVLDSLFP